MILITRGSQCCNCVLTGVSLPEIVLPTTAHPAFDKAANYFGMKIKHIPLTKSYTVDLAAMQSAITSNTVMLVGSVPNFPYGTMDDIGKLELDSHKQVASQLSTKVCKYS